MAKVQNMAVQLTDLSETVSDVTVCDGQDPQQPVVEVQHTADSVG